MKIRDQSATYCKMAGFLHVDTCHEIICAMCTKDFGHVTEGWGFFKHNIFVMIMRSLLKWRVDFLLNL